MYTDGRSVPCIVLYICVWVLFYAGKLKMGFQCVAVGACLVGLALLAPEGEPIPLWLEITIVGSVWLSVISTVHSGLLYVKAAGAYLK